MDSELLNTALDKRKTHFLLGPRYQTKILAFYIIAMGLVYVLEALGID